MKGYAQGPFVTHVSFWPARSDYYGDNDFSGRIFSRTHRRAATGCRAVAAAVHRRCGRTAPAPPPLLRAHVRIVARRRGRRAGDAGRCVLQSHLTEGCRAIRAVAVSDRVQQVHRLTCAASGIARTMSRSRRSTITRAQWTRTWKSTRRSTRRSRAWWASCRPKSAPVCCSRTCSTIRSPKSPTSRTRHSPA